MPKKLMQDIFQGYEDKENRKLADMMRIEQLTQLNAENAATEAAPEAEVEGEMGGIDATQTV